jgi:protein SCO1/2
MLAAVPAARAQPAPRAVVAAGVDERPGAEVPLDVPFTSATRGAITLRDVVDGTRPTLLVLAYARCTMLCSLVLRGVTDAAQRIAPAAGRDYHLVIVGLDARETIDEARRKYATVAADLGRGELAYLVGSRASIDRVADAVGFRYAWDARTEQYAHPAVLFVLTPEGKVSRYLHGVQFQPAEVETALADAAAGRIVSAVAAEVLRCFRFDPAMRREGARALAFLRIGGAVIFVMLLATIIGLICWERRRGRRS